MRVGCIEVVIAVTLRRRIVFRTQEAGETTLRVELVGQRCWPILSSFLLQFVDTTTPGREYIYNEVV